jgi:hypothetical protein
VYNNLVVDNSHGGIVVGDWDMNGLRENVSITCNTVLDNGYPNGGGIGVQDFANVTDITIRNNIISGNKNWQIEAGFIEKRRILCDHNLINEFRESAGGTRLGGPTTSKATQV